MSSLKRLSLSKEERREGEGFGKGRDGSLSNFDV